MVYWALVDICNIEVDKSLHYFLINIVESEISPDLSNSMY
jgi:hypothetical protein